MSSIDQIINKIEDKVNDLTVLDIKTLMGEMVLETEGKRVVAKLKAGQKVQGITSRIDLVDGDITTNITEDFYKSYPELVQWHQAREVKGNEIIESNISTVISMISQLRKMLPEKPDNK